ncbi:hypothetical protein F5146DRAFT_1006306 [Armillaria mellea]|nr:hypothetical protein F5146DRAFT_1006306 [Armillaria mellea]
MIYEQDPPSLVSEHGSEGTAKPISLHDVNFGKVYTSNIPDINHGKTEKLSPCYIQLRSLSHGINGNACNPHQFANKRQKLVLSLVSEWGVILHSSRPNIPGTFPQCTAGFSQDLIAAWQSSRLPMIESPILASYIQYLVAWEDVSVFSWDPTAAVRERLGYSNVLGLTAYFNSSSFAPETRIEGPKKMDELVTDDMTLFA